MPIYEYICPQCRKTFELRRPFSECDAITNCPNCNAECDRILSAAFSQVMSTPPDSYLITQDKAKEKMWQSQRRADDDKIKNPDPLKRWREERQEACGRGPEAWVEWAKEELVKQEKEKDEQNMKETAEKDYANWARKSTTVDPKEKERYWALGELQKMEAEKQALQEKMKWNPDTETWEEEKPVFDYPPVIKPTGQKKESRFERKKVERDEESEDEIPEGEQYL
ncbi:putative regulatory protein, FmdB family [Dehalogenimonas formicexedens]|uniref:Putative regulatory protein, FmdB family n=1 Tax=Dehalogenimonas formicexedens TaxID=1839801 RepID=A0A1P8F6Y2_9CHLR|nr:zinc ribbon domain-containing protein [Dehalogenimonas formicexedens]APV44208.1 putative regulatory protein, FmdB family [Dehalogenimonas formicexedens]